MDNEGNYKQNYFVYIFDLFANNRDELLKKIEELELPVKDKTKNYILQLKQEGIEKSILNLLGKRSSIEFICDVMEVTPEYVARIQGAMDR